MVRNPGCGALILADETLPCSVAEVAIDYRSKRFLPSIYGKWHMAHQAELQIHGD
jgi:hypothetical protein